MHLASEACPACDGMIGHPSCEQALLTNVGLCYGFDRTRFTANAAIVARLASPAAKRTPALPDVPTIAETGLSGFQVDGWYALMAPAKTPKAIIDRLYRDTAAVLKLPDVVTRIEAVGLEPAGISPQEFDSYIRAELKKWGKLIKEAGIKAE
jgi:tripartite-type tricarboxylate transporter receptor subunit TctC